MMKDANEALENGEHKEVSPWFTQQYGKILLFIHDGLLKGRRKATSKPFHENHTTQTA